MNQDTEPKTVVDLSKLRPGDKVPEGVFGSGTPTEEDPFAEADAARRAQYELRQGTIKPDPNGPGYVKK